MERQIFWLASYPKSGNTLLRYILTALFFTEDGKFTFDKSELVSLFDHTVIVNKNKQIFGNEYDKLGDIKIFYKYLYQLQSRSSLNIKGDFIFFKTHAGLFKVKSNAFTSMNNTRGIIYLIRDPRDISISMARHYGVSINKSIDIMFNSNQLIEWVQNKKDNKKFTKKTIPKSLMSSWDKHIMSWTSIKNEVPSLILRYEDLVYNKELTLRDLVFFFEKYYNFKFNNIERKISNILKTTDFKIFKKYEEKNGFNEATQHGKFFAVGEKNQWKDKLTLDQLIKIEDGFGTIMKSFNYKLSVEL